MYGFIKSDLSDHDLAKWLRERNWISEHHVGNSVHFVNNANQTIAVLFYDNQKCERVPFLHSDFV